MEKTSLMQNIRTAASKLKGCKLKRQNLLAPVLDNIRQELQLASKEEVMVLVVIFDRQCSLRNTDLDDLSNYLECSALEAMELLPSISALQQRGYIMAENKREKLIARKEFMLRPEVFNSLVEGSPVKPYQEKEQQAFDQFDLCAAVHELIEGRTNETMETSQVMSMTEQIENEHTDLPLVKELRKLVKDTADRVLFYEMCKDFTNDCNGGHSDLNSTLQDIFDRIMDRVRIKKSIIEENHCLLTLKLAELREQSELHLLPKALHLLFGEAASAFVGKNSGLDRYEFVDRVHDIACDISNQFFRYEAGRARQKVLRLEEENAQLEMLRKLRILLPDIDDRFLFYLICYEKSDQDTYYVNQLQIIYTKTNAMQVQRKLKEQTHVLQTTGLVELTANDMADRSELVLTEKGKELFLEEDADLFEENAPTQSLITPEQIGMKRLFFEPGLERQLMTLRNSLNDSNYRSLCQRLKSKQLPTGIAVLLYGQPGTGKTESVMQIARATGRSVMHVDISATKTCWFGESEKLIKGVFTQYRRLCEKSKMKPILLFNEADAIFSKRKDSNSSSVAQTENAIQNIILEEMETLDGILIATTNLATNLDSAFERRFLFKIRFDKPTVEAKARIWCNKLPVLTPAEAATLAAQYDFSGGEIDNVVRKVTMEEIIGGKMPSMDMLTRICGEEKIEKKTARIGFY